MPSSLRRRVLVLLLLFVTQVTAATLFVFRLAAQHRAASESFRDAIVLSRLVHNLESRIHAAAMAGNDHLIAGAPPIQKERFAAADADVARLFRTLAGRELADPLDRRTLATVERRYADISTLAARLFAIEQPVGNLVAGELMEQMDRAADDASSALGTLLAEADRRIEAAGARAAALAFRLRVAALTSLAAVVLLSGASVALLNGWILKPLREMRESITRMQLGGVPAPPDRAAAPARRPPRNELSEVSDRLRAKFLEIGRLAELTAAINEGLSLDEVLDLVYERFAGLIPYDRIGLALVEAEGTVVRSRWSRTRAPRKMVPDGYSASLARSSLAQVLAGGRPRILNDLAEYLRLKPESQSTALIVAEGMRSSLTCPLVLRGVPVGVMFFSSMRTDAYRDAHVDLFLQISGQLAAIVEKSRLHDELVRLDRLKNDFLGMAAHDIRNPAAAIGGYAEIVLHDAPAELPGDSLRMLERIRALAAEISTLLDGLLDVAVIESGTFSLAPQSVALAEFLGEVRARNQLLVESKGDELVVASAGAESACFDPVRIHQVLGNLIGNAVKYSPAGSRVHVQATASDSALHFAVRDEGPGIPVEEQAGLFRDFRRASTRPTGGERSTGLGLAICRRIVEAHGGEIGVDSRPGEGATFRFSLPRQTAA